MSKRKKLKKAVRRILAGKISKLKIREEDITDKIYALGSLDVPALTGTDTRKFKIEVEVKYE
jgi:hypothetical protein